MKIKVVIVSLLVLLLGSGFAPLPAQDPGVDVLDRILVIVASFATLAGVSALIGVAVALFRVIGWVSTDEQVSKITAGLNLAAFVILVGIGVFRPDLSLDFLDSVAARVATIALFVLGLLTQILTPAPVFRALYVARVPGLWAIGERYEARARSASMAEPPENWVAEAKK